MNRSEKKINDKGFSLVELIIVIAIMAILVGVLAPQFMKYVERSKKSTDCQNVAAIVTACQVYATDPSVTDQITNGAIIKLNTTSAAVSTTTASNNTDKALTAAGISTLALKSQKWPAAAGNISEYQITVNVDANGSVSFTGTTLSAGYDILKGQYE